MELGIANEAGILRKCETRKLIVNRMIPMNEIFFLVFFFCSVAETTTTKTAISRSEIIERRRFHAILTHLKTLYTTNCLRTPVDGAASIYRETLQRFGTNFVFFFWCTNFFFGSLTITLVPPQTAETMYILYTPSVED